MFNVDDNCIKCGLCAELCPSRIIKYEKEAKPFVPKESEVRCLRCGQCVAFCPKSACSLSFHALEDRIILDPSTLPSAESAETLIRSRRSIRRYKNQPVEDGLILRILESARYAPSAVNAQPVRWIVVKERKNLVELGLLMAGHFKNSLIGKQGKQGKQEDQERQEFLKSIAAVQEKGHDVFFRGAPHLAVAVVNKDALYPEDACIALTYFELAAHALGVGCCWAGYFTAAAKTGAEIKSFLKLADSDVVIGGQMFGLPQAPAFGKILPPRKKIDLTWI